MEKLKIFSYIKAMVLANTLIVEITPINIRGKTLFLMFNFFTIGELVTILIGYIFLKVKFYFYEINF
jgi:hypothetical protein